MTEFTVGCFGKLPIYPDFIRSRGSGSEVQELDQWFQEGIHFAKTRFGSSWAGEFEKGGLWNFVYRGSDGKRFLVGSSVPSRDQGGRQYPFFLFLSVELPGFGVPLYYAPVSFSDFLMEANHMIQEGWVGLEMKEYVSQISHMAIKSQDMETVKASYHEFLDDSRSGDFWSGMFGDPGHSGKYSVIQNLVDILAPLKKNPPGRFGFGLSFPLNGQGNSGRYREIPFWCQMIEAMMGQTVNPYAIFWRPDSEAFSVPHRMTLFLQKPTTRNLMFLLRPGKEEDSIFPVVSVNERDLERIKGVIPETTKRMLDREDLPLRGLLDELKGGQDD